MVNMIGFAKADAINDIYNSVEEAAAEFVKFMKVIVYFSGSLPLTIKPQSSGNFEVSFRNNSIIIDPKQCKGVLDLIEVFDVELALEDKNISTLALGLAYLKTRIIGSTHAAAMRAMRSQAMKITDIDVIVNYKLDWLPTAEPFDPLATAISTCSFREGSQVKLKKGSAKVYKTVSNSGYATNYKYVNNASTFTIGVTRGNYFYVYITNGQRFWAHKQDLRLMNCK